jgi:uncharacterized SAM-binding protein YcdF (DUF218 family)
MKKFSFLKISIDFKSIGRLFFKYFKRLIYFLGVVFLFGWLLSFTDIPYNLYYRLGTYNCELEKEPNYIVLMGGGGMPSADGLLRCHFAASAWLFTPNAHVFVVIPSDTTNIYGSPEKQMAREIIMRGVDSSKILFEINGYNTQSQAMEIGKLFNNEAKDTIALRLITTPEHMYRSVKVFRKVGFKYVGGTPTFETGLKEKKLLKNEMDQPFFLNIRYNMWSYMKYEITVVRECFAIIYYKLRGWI